MYPNSTSNSPKAQNNLQMFIGQQNKHMKKGSQPEMMVKQGGTKQNLISQLQNNQNNQSMLYRLHQQQVGPNQGVDEGEPQYEKKNNANLKTYGSMQSSLVQTRQTIQSLKGSSPPGKINRMTMQGKNQQTYNQNRIVKQQSDADGYYTQQNPREQRMAPPIATQQSAVVSKKIKKEGGSKIHSAISSKEQLVSTAQNKSIINSRVQTNGTKGTQQSKDNLTRQSIQKGPQSSTSNKVYGGQSAQMPHYIKVKSKTNANPTRQNSPRFTQKNQISHQRNVLRDSNQFYQNPAGKTKNKQSLLQQSNQMVMQSTKGYVFSQPSSPNKDSVLVEANKKTDLRMGYAVSVIEPNLNVQDVDNMPNQSVNQQMARSVISGKMSALSNSGQNTGANQQQQQMQYKKQKYKNITMDQKNMNNLTEISSQNRQLKPQSSFNLQYNSQQNSSKNNGQMQGSQSTAVQTRHDQHSNQYAQKTLKQRVQSGQSSSNGGNITNNTMRRLNSPGTTVMQGQMVGKIQGQNPNPNMNVDQKQRQTLNQAVSQNIGNIASGSNRRENRNKMMKTQMKDGQVQESKSVVGSMGSLSQFMGIDPQKSQQDMDYVQYMNAVESDNKTSDSQNLQQKLYNSQLQQMHVNQMNPMFFSTGEIPNNSNQVMSSFTQNQLAQMRADSMIEQQKMGPSSGGQKIASSAQGSISNFQMNDINDYQNANIHYQVPIEQQQIKINSQNVSKKIMASVTPGSGPGHVKTSMIQMRKINPVCKTAVNGSYSTSLDKKVSKDSKAFHNAKKSQYEMLQEQSKIVASGRPIPATAKASFNNSPNGQSKMGSMISNMPPNKQVKNKPQQMGQPAGDIPIMANYYTQKGQQNGSQNSFIEQDYGTQGESKRQNPVTQSMMVMDSKQGKREGSHGMKTQPKYKHSKMESQQIDQFNQSQDKYVSMGSKTAAHLANGGKLKIKMMSESSSPMVNFMQQNHQQQKQPGNQMVPNQMMNQYFMQNKHKFAQIDSPKDSSIERARQTDIMGQETRIQQNQNSKIGYIHKTQDIVTGGKEEDGNDSEMSKGKKGNTTEYILTNIQKNSLDKLSPRSKEVCLIKQLIQDCFKKYNKPPKTQLELYKIGKMLGKGAFGKVNLGLHRLTRKLVAIKSINMDFMKEESQKKKIMNEINILKSLRHPNNIKIMETFQTDKHHMIVMELCPGGDLLNYVRKRRKLTEKSAKFVFKQIMQGITYLHQNKVSHRDIKLDNILLDGHGNIKIGDFGVSKRIEENEVLFEQCGTPAYIAPEIVKDMGYKGFPVDIWSAGICLYAMLYGNVPFKANQIGDLSTVEQLNQDIEYKKDVVSQSAIDLMKLMLQKIPSKRINAEDVLSHDWLNDEEKEHIDIFDEQELELIRKEFTYVVQKKKLKDFEAQKDECLQGELPYMQASRKEDDLNTQFTECSLQTHDNTLMKNDSVRSVILCPFNTQTGDKTADKIIEQAIDLMEDKDCMIRFHPRVREIDRNYEKLNNQDFDNGVYHKYAYKQKGKNGDKKDDLKEEEIRQSDVKINNLVSKENQEKLRRRKRENADINYHNYYVKINNNIINETVRLGFPLQYVQKCLKENTNNHCTTTYYLLCMDQNF